MHLCAPGQPSLVIPLFDSPRRISFLAIAEKKVFAGLSGPFSSAQGTPLTNWTNLDTKRGIWQGAEKYAEASKTRYSCNG